MSDRPGPSTLARRVPWVALALVVAVGLALGGPGSDPQTTDDQVSDISEGIACPTCSGQSAATSDAPSARAIRVEVARRLDDGQSSDQIRDYFAGRYGDDILLTPGQDGAAGLVWVVPVAVTVLAIAGLTYAFWRWQHQPVSRASRADRDLVNEAMTDPHGEGHGR